MEEVLGLVWSVGRDSVACYGGQGHGVRGGADQGRSESGDGEISPGQLKNGPDQGRHGSSGVGSHGQVGSAEKGLGTIGGRGRE